MKAEQYIEERLDQQIAWYDSKSLSYQRSFKWLRLVEFILAASIPFLASFENTNTIIGLSGVMIAVITGAIGLFQFQENWVKYRATGEALKQEKYLYLTHTTPYGTTPYDTTGAQTNFNKLVERVESIISRENAEWVRVSSGGEQPETMDSTAD